MSIIVSEFLLSNDLVMKNTKEPNFVNYNGDSTIDYLIVHSRVQHSTPLHTHHILFPKVLAELKQLNINFYNAHMISGDGNFGSYLYRFHIIFMTLPAPFI